MPRSRRGLIAAAAGAALAALALPRPGLWAFGWIGLAPFVLAANASSRKRDAALAGFWAGFAYHGVVLYWVYLTCRFARVPVPVSVLAWAALCAFLALNWAAAAALARAASEDLPRPLRPAAWAVCWTAVAAATEHWTPRMAVDLLAYTQWPNLALLQCGSWGGPHLLGFSIVLLNAALAEAWNDAQENNAAAVAPLAAALALAGGLWAHGAWTLAKRPADPGAVDYVQILQPNIDQYAKWDEHREKDTIDNFHALVWDGPPPENANIEMFLWPETSVPRWQNRRKPVQEAADWAIDAHAMHLVGVVASADGISGPANGVQAIALNGEVAGFYAKRELVPFGEYVPLRSWIPRFVIENWLAVLDNLGDLDAGAPDQPLIETHWGPTAVTICYESMFPRWARRDAARGARLLVNVTNDGWYKDTWAPYQHLHANVYRAIENRIETIRSGNTGISAVIDPWGVVTASLPLNTRGALYGAVPMADPFPRRSFYARNGDWLGFACMALALLPFIV